MTSVTTQLTDWICKVQLSDVPHDIQERTKCILLDGIACGLVAARLPWSEIAARAILELEGPGPCSVWGWDKVRHHLKVIFAVLPTDAT